MSYIYLRRRPRALALRGGVGVRRHVACPRGLHPPCTDIEVSANHAGVDVPQVAPACSLYLQVAIVQILHHQHLPRCRVGARVTRRRTGEADEVGRVGPVGANAMHAVGAVQLDRRRSSRACVAEDQPRVGQDDVALEGHGRAASSIGDTSGTSCRDGAPGRDRPETLDDRACVGRSETTQRGARARVEQQLS